MLQSMRNFSQSWFVKGLFIALAASFVLWGIGDIFRGGAADTSVATVGSVKISADDYTRDYRNMLRGMGQRLGMQLTPDQAQKMGIPERALQGLIDQTALGMVADRLGLAVGDAQVSATVHSMQAFAGPLGTFDRMTFLQRLQDAGFTEQSYIDAVRNDIQRDQVLSAAHNGFIAPQGLLRAFYAYAKETRAVQYLTVPASAAGNVAPPTDAQLAAYIKAHADRFSVPDYRAITYAEAGPDDVGGQLTVTDAQIAEEYDRRKDNPVYNYDVPEKRDVQQLNFKDEAAAKAARAKLDGGTSFDALAKSLGETPLDLGTVSQSQLGDRGKAVFALTQGGVTQPVKNLAGYALFRVSKITAAGGKSLADVKGDIRKDLMAVLAASKLEDVANDYMDASSGGLDLSAAAKKAGMHVVHVPAVDSSGLAPDGSKANIPQDPVFLDQAFHAEIGADGDPFSGKDGHKYVLRVDSETPSRIKPLSAVRDQATAMWLADAREKALADKAQALAAKVKSSQDMSALAASLKTPMQSSGALTRGQPLGDLPADLVTKIFSVPPGGAVSGPSAKGDSYIVARVSGVSHPAPPPGDPVYAQFSQELSNDAADSIALAIAAAERAKLGVTTNPQQVNQISSSEGA
jgi:peptidyl-prolyl cis-trans isomerase D